MTAALVCVGLSAGSSAQAASVSLTTTDAVNTSSFNAPGNWSNGAAPSAANNYLTGAFTLRSPANSSSYNFAGASLSVPTGGRFLLKGTGGQIITVGSLSLNGGLVDMANSSTDGYSETLAGSVLLNTGTTSYLGALSGAASETLLVTAGISGTGNLQVAGTTVNSGADNGTVVFAGTDTSTGTTTVNGGTLMVSGTVSGSSGIIVAGSSSVNAILGGTGTIAPGTASQISVGAYGYVAPGSTAVGTLTVDGGGTTATVLSFSGGGQLTFRLNASQQNDQLRLKNGAAGDLVFNNTTVNFNDLSGGSLTAGAYTLITADVPGAYAGLTLDGNNYVTSGLTIGNGLNAYFGAKLQVVGNNLVLQIVNTPNATGTQLTVDYAFPTGVATQVASGALHAISSAYPSQYLIDGLKVDSDRGADHSSSLPSLFDPATYARVVAAGAPPLLVGLYYAHGNYWPGENGDDYTMWRNEVTSVYNDAVSHGYGVYSWITWNEPDSQWTGTHTTAGYYATHKVAYQTIKALNPNALIEAPEDSIYSFSYITAFLTYCQANNCVPDIVSWHELYPGNAVDVEAHTKQLQTWLAANGFSAKPFAVTEYQGHDYGAEDAYDPAINVAYIARLERSVRNGLLFGLKSNWNQVGGDPNYKASLGDTADPATASYPRGMWWTYNAYKDMTGQLLQTSVVGSSYVDALSGIDAVMNRSIILVGNESTAAQNITLQLANLDHATTLVRNGAVHLHVDSYGPDNTVLTPTLVLDGDYTVSGNALTVALPPLAASNAARIYVTSGTANAAATVLEAEALPISYTAGDTTSVVAPPNASNGAALSFVANAVGDAINFTVAVPTTGVYSMTGRLLTGASNAMTQLYVNGRAYGGPKDAYGAATTISEFTFGNLALLAGNNVLSFVVVNKNPADGSSAYNLGFDSFTFALLNPLKTVLGQSADGAHLTITFDQYADPTLTYQLQACDDLASWSTIWTSSGAQNVSSTLTVTDPELTENHPRRFYRLVIAQGASQQMSSVIQAPAHRANTVAIKAGKNAFTPDIFVGK